MNLHFSFKSAKTPDLEQEIQQHVQKLRKFLHVFRPELVHLHGTVDRGQREGTTVSLNLRLPTGQLFATSDGTTPVTAAKASFEDLVKQLKRHKELLREKKSRRWAGRERRGRSVGELQRMEQTVERVLSGEERRGTNGHATEAEIDAATFADENKNLLQADVRHYIDANLHRLERFIRHELAFREGSGQIEPGELTSEEVVDEVVVEALSHDEKPGDISIERWLYKLAIRAIRHLVGQNGDAATLHLEQTVRPQNVTGSDEDLLQYHQPGEALNREDTIADITAGTPEDLAANDELIEQLQGSLRELPSDERHAFVLFTIEGFTIGEIAQIMERRPERVKDDIQAVRQHLIKKLPPSNILKKKLLQRSNVA